MTHLFFEGLSNSGEEDLFEYDASGKPVDLTASIDAGQGAGVVAGYDNELGAFGVDPGPAVAGAGSDLFFAGNYNGLSTLLAYDETNNTVLVFRPSNAWGSGVTPQDLVADGAKVFFVGVDAAGNSTLWKSNGTGIGTKEISGSPTDLGDMTLQNANLFFRGESDLEAFNTTTDTFAVVAGSEGLDPQDMVSAYSSGLFVSPSTNLFMAGTNANGRENIFMKTGGVLEQFKSNVYSGAMNPDELTPLTTMIVVNSTTTINDSGVYFSGVDNAGGERGVYFVNAATGSSVGGTSSHKAEEVVASTFGGAAGGLDPFDFTAFKGELYFTGDDSFGPGRGLFVYNPATSSATELIDSNRLDLTDGYVANWSAANAPTLGIYGGELYFGALNPNTTGAASTNQLYEYSGSGSTFTLVSVNGQNTIGGQPANLVKF